jgi:GNAT superfamily N-acetyltransferase
MELRRATPADLSDVGELTVAAYEEFLTGAEGGYREHLRDAERRFREAELWVAELDGEVVGTVSYCPPGSPWRELARDDTDGEFRMLAVDPAARGRGVGFALAELGEQRARGHGATRLVLSSLPDMASAHRIYARLGLTRLPELDWDPVPGVRLIAFAKELT